MTVSTHHPHASPQSNPVGSLPKVRHLELWSHISNIAVFELPHSVIDHPEVVAFFIDTIGLVRVVKSGRVPLREDETDEIY